MAALGTGYPDTLRQAVQEYPRQIVAGYVRKAGKLIKCLENKPPLKK